MDGSVNNGPAPGKWIRVLWTRLVEPPPVIQGGNRRLSRLLNAILLAIIFLGIAIQLEYNLRWGAFSIGNKLAYGCLGILLVAYIINKLGYFRPAVFLTIACTAITIFVAYLVAERLYESPNLLFYLIIPILMTEFFLGLGEYLIVSAVILGGILTLQAYGYDVVDTFSLLFTLTVILGIANFSRRRHQQEQQSALSEAERKYRTLVEEIPAITYIDQVGTNSRMVFVSPQIESVLGIKPQKWMEGDHDVWREHLHPEDRERVVARHEEAQKGGLPLEMEYRMIRPDGREVWIRDHATVEKDQTGKPILFRGVITDITEKKLFEIALEKSEERYRTIFDTTGVGIWEEDFSRVLEAIDGLKARGVTDFRAYFEQNPDFVREIASLIEVTDINRAVMEMLQVQDRSQVLGAFGKRIAAETLRPLTSELTAIAAGQTLYENESVLRTNSGKLVYEWISIYFPKHREGFKRVIVVTVDITKQKQAEKVQELLLEVGEAVHTSDDLSVLFRNIHASLGRLMDASNFYVALREPGEGQIYSFPYVTDQYETFAEVEDLTGGLTAYVARLGKPALIDEEEHRRLVETGEVHTLGAPSQMWIGSPLKSYGRVIGVVAMQSYDDPHKYDESHLRLLELISDHIGLAVERKRVEEALRDSQGKLEAFFSQSLDGFFFMMLDQPIRWDATVDKEAVLDYVFEHQHITKVNEAMLAQYGLEREQMLGMTPAASFAHDITQGRAIWRALFDTGHFHIESDERKADGTQMWIEGDYICLYDKEGRITGHFGIQREITDRKRAEEALRDSEERYRKLIELSPEVIWISHDHTIVYANRACLGLLGATSIAQVIGRSTFEIIHPDFHAQINERARFMQETGKPVSVLEEQLIRLDGTLVDVEVTAAPIRYGDVTAIQVFARDISLRKRAENAIRASEERFRNIFEFSGIPIWVEDFSGVKAEIENLRQQGVNDIHDYVMKHPEFAAQAAGKIRVVDVNSAVLKLFEIKDKAELLGSLDKIYSPEALMNFRDEVLVIADGRTYYEGETSSITLNGKRRDEWVIMSVPDRHENLDRVLVTVLDISDRKQREREMEAVAAVSSALRHARTRAEMLPVILDQVQVLLHAEGGAIVMRDADTGRGKIEAARGLWVNFAGLEIPAELSIYRQVINTGEALITNKVSDLIAANVGEYSNRIVGESVECVAGIPLQANEENVGVIYIGRSRPFTQLELRTLTSIADMSASAIQRVTVHELALRRAEQLAIVNEIGRTLAETLDLEQIHDQLHRAVFHLLPGSNALFISRYDSEAELIHCVFGLENDTRINAAELPPLRLRPPGEGTQSQVIHSGKPLIVGDLNERARNDPTSQVVGAGEQMTHSALYVPMVAHNNVIGILQVQSYLPNHYSQAEAELLSVVANTAAAAIENARLFEEVHQRIDQLQALHDIDAAISSSHDLRITLDILLSNAISLLGVDAADVLQLNAFTYNLEYAAGQGFKTTFVDMERLPFEESFAGQVASQRKMVILKNLSTDEPNHFFSRFLKIEGFVNYVGIPLMAKGLLIGILEIYHRHPLGFGSPWLDLLKTLAGQAALAIDNTELFMRLQESNTQLVMAYDATIEGWSRALDLRDRETEGHTRRVTDLTVQLARTMHIPETELIHIKRGALLHDIGKMGVPDQILLKPSELTKEEWDIMRRHPQYAYDLISPIRYLQQSLDIPYSHHEHWDGNGYPRGLKGEIIPLAARVFAVVDVWDALRSDRPYRPAWPEEKAIEYIRGLSGKQFDPRVVSAFLQMMRK
ncbi:MAG: GAF domain-containing protein [Chloroflexota bacterium]